MAVYDPCAADAADYDIYLCEERISFNMDYVTDPDGIHSFITNNPEGLVVFCDKSGCEITCTSEIALYVADLWYSIKHLFSGFTEPDEDSIHDLLNLYKAETSSDKLKTSIENAFKTFANRLKAVKPMNTDQYGFLEGHLSNLKNLMEEAGMGIECFLEAS